MGKKVKRIEKAAPARHPETGRFTPAAAPLAARQVPPTPHPVPGAPTVRHINLQATTPRPGPLIATASGAGPMAGAIRSHQGTAAVQVLDQARAASVTNAAVGRAAGADGISHLPEHQAPTGTGAVPGVTPNRGDGWQRPALERAPWA